MSAVAVIGLGSMGGRIARRLLGAGHELVVWNRTPARAAELVAAGARAAATPAQAAAEAELLITMVVDPAALRAVSAGRDGIAAGAHVRLTVIEMSTVGPPAVADLRQTLPPEAALLDAPVLGSVAEVEAGTLTIFAGGPESALGRARPLLEQLGSVVHVGDLGTGAAAKLVANAALFSSVALLGETIALGRDLGLADDVLYQVLAATPLADQARRRRPAIAAGDYRLRFGLSLAVKDAELIRAAARAEGRDVRLMEATRSWLADAAAVGLGGRDYTAVLASIIAPANSANPSEPPPQ
jgi:3-hydroxyisobutyrate dehydrogenase-like beta-hydroxyacid dehydrogenase